MKMDVMEEMTVQSASDLLIAARHVYRAARELGSGFRCAALLASAVEFMGANDAGETGEVKIRLHRPEGPGRFRVEMNRPAGAPSLKGVPIPECMVEEGTDGERVLLGIDVSGSASGHRAPPAREYLNLLAELRRRDLEVAQLTDELAETNRGVVALYAELEEKAETTRRASDLKTRFLANMTHEFRTPLNSILNISRMLMDRLDGELTSEQEKQVRFIQKGAADLSELVNDLLDLARVEAGRVVIRPSEFDVADLFAVLRGILRPLLPRETKVKLIFGDAPSGLRLHTDEGKLAQILRNLVSNALKFTEEGEVKIFVKPCGSMITFYVADTGIGICEEQQDRIFEEYVQLESKGSAAIPGTGLGLPIARRLAEILGGEVRLEKSAPGEGSIFSATIPMVYEEPPKEKTMREIEKDPTRFPVAVLAEDDAVAIYEKFLRGTGFQVLAVPSDEREWSRIGELQPIVVLVSAASESGPAFRFLARHKRNDETQTIPLWMAGPAECEERALALGADAFFRGAIPRDDLIHGLRELCPLDARDEVLIVDDDELSRYLLRNLLQDTRLRVVETDRGAEAIAMVRRSPPFCLFIDLHMPDKSGFDVIRELKADPALAAIPIIVHTGIPLNADERNWLERESVAVLSKSTQNRDLALAELRQVLQKASENQKAEVIR